MTPSPHVDNNFSLFVLLILCFLTASQASSDVSLHEGYRLLRGRPQHESTSNEDYDPGLYFLSRQPIPPSNAPRISPPALQTAIPVPCKVRTRPCRRLFRRRKIRVVRQLARVNNRLQTIFDALVVANNPDQRTRLEKELLEFKRQQADLVELDQDIYEMIIDRACTRCIPSPSPSPSVSPSSSPSMIAQSPSASPSLSAIKVRRCAFLGRKLDGLRKKIRVIARKIRRLTEKVNKKEPGVEKMELKKEVRQLKNRRERLKQQVADFEEDVAEEGCT